MLAQPPAQIAYVHHGAVWTMNASGAHARRVTRGSDVAWSPDGVRLAVVARGVLRTVRSDGTHARVVARHAGAPAYSPDATRIAFAAGGHAFTVASGGGDRRVVPGTARVARVTDWTPDGRLLYDSGGDVREVGTTGAGDRQLLAQAGGAVLSPDGAQLAFASYRTRLGDIAVAAADGGDPRVVLRTSADETDPAWSADGARIAFSSARNLPAARFFPDKEIYSVATDGSCLTWLTNGNLSSTGPAWAPGAGAPDRCGHRHRRVLLEGRRPRHLLWLGFRTGQTLLADVQTLGRDGFLIYGDCAAFSPRRCAFLTVAEDDACRSGIPYLHRFARRARRHLVLRDGLGLRGRTFVDSGLRPRQIRALRRADGRPVGPPRLARDAWRLLPARLREKVRPC